MEISRIRNSKVMSLKILLDTNFLVAPFDLNIDVFEELRGYELITLEDCIFELKKLRPEVVDFIKTKVSVVREIFKNHDVDDKIVEFAAKHNAYIATSDKNLKAKAEALNIPVVFIRQKKYVVLPDV